MKRRDMIIAAVLINLSLLALLFIFAVPIFNETSQEEPVLATASATPSEAQVATPVALPELATAEVAQEEQLDPATKETPQATEKPLEATPAQTVAPTTEKLPKVEQPVKSEKPKEAPCREVTVKKGDYLEKIAHANGVTVADIKRANGLKNEQIRIGQILKVPASSAKKAKTATTTNGSGAEYYTLVKGDSPWVIAKRFGIKVEDLLSLNQLDEKKARNLKPGDALRVK